MRRRRPSTPSQTTATAGAAPPARRLALARAALVGVALAASAYQSNAIVPQMNATAAQIPGAIDSVPKSDPRRMAYDGLHKQSTRVYGTAFLCVVAALALVAFGRKRPPSGEA